MIRILIFIFILSSTSMFGQKEDYNWIFGWSARDSLIADSRWASSILDFNTIPPSFYEERDITFKFDKTNTIISDSLGQVLFYCNGMAVNGPDHNYVINGDTINYSPRWNNLAQFNEFGEKKPGGFRVVQLACIVPKPGFNSEWILVYQNYENIFELFEYELWYSLISKNDEGDFEIVEKDLLLDSGISKGGVLTACQHGNGKDWWLIQFKKNRVVYYLIDNNGIRISHSQEIPFEVLLSSGQTKFSKKGDQFVFYAIENEGDSTLLFTSKFDRCFGELSKVELNKFPPDGISLGHGMEFSPNGRFVYVAELERILQYDLEAEDIKSSEIVVGEYDGFLCDFDFDQRVVFGLMQRGPDDKIYISNSASCFYLHIIHNPDEKGLACNFEQRAIKLPSFHIGTIPNFNTYRLGSLDGSDCDTSDINNVPVSKFAYYQGIDDYLSIQFDDLSYYEPTDWSWDFGDGNTSFEKDPFHEYDTDGLYIVCLTVSNEYAENTSCDSLRIGVTSISNIPDFEAQVNVFPNPVQDYTRLVFENYLPKQASLHLSTIDGKKVYVESIENQESLLDLSHIPNGTYFYEIIDEGMVMTVGKLVFID